MLDLERQCLGAAHWSRQQYEDLFRTHDNGPGRLVLTIQEIAHEAEPESRPAAASSRVLGFLTANQIESEWELENIVIAPAFRRRGLATQLFTAFLTRARETNGERVFLEVRESNQAARALYVRHGFKERGRRKLYYANPQEDAVLYRLSLAHPSTHHPSA